MSFVNILSAQCINKSPPKHHSQDSQVHSDTCNKWNLQGPEQRLWSKKKVTNFLTLLLFSLVILKLWNPILAHHGTTSTHLSWSWETSSALLFFSLVLTSTIAHKWLTLNSNFRARFGGFILWVKFLPIYIIIM